MTQCTSSGYEAKWAFEAAGGTFDASSERWPFLSDSMAKIERQIITEGITGSRAYDTANRRRGPYSVAGTLECNPSWIFWASWLPRILGAAAVGTTFDVANELPAWDMVSSRVNRVVKYEDCKVDKATIRFAPDLVTCSLDCMGLVATETAGGISFPAASLPTGASAIPQAFLDCTMTIGGEAVNLVGGELLIDNMLQPLVFAGAANTSCLREGPRMVKFTSQHTSSENDWEEMYDLASPATIVLTVGYGNLSTTFTLRECFASNRTPTVDGKDEIKMGFEWIAMASGSTTEITVVNDSTP